MPCAPSRSASKRAALSVHRRALAALSLPPRRFLIAALALLAVQVAFGLLHVLLGVVESLLALHAEAFEHALHFGEAVAQGLLALSELLVAGIAALVGFGVGLALIEVGRWSGVVRLALVVLSRPWPSLSALPLALALVAAEGVVAQRLLVVQKLPEIVQLLAHRAVGRAFFGLARAAHVLEHLLHLIEHRLGLVARFVARQLLHAVHQLVEILRLLVRVLRALVAVALGLARHFAGEAPGRLAQVLHQFP